MSDADPRRLFHAHVDAVHGYVARRLGRDDALDVVGEVFEIALRQHDRFDPSIGSERGWLFGIATNLIRRHWRTEQRHLRALERLAVRPSLAVDPLLRVEDRLDADELAGQVLAALRELPAADRDLVALVAWEGCSYKECAEALDVPIGTVRSRLHRVRHELRALVGDDVDESASNEEVTR